MNGYCQINMNGQVKGLKFNLHAVRTLEGLFSTNKTVDEENILYMTQLIYAGLCGNRYVKSMGSEPICKESFEEVSDWVDENIVNKDYALFTPINEAFASSKAVTLIVPDGEKKSPKKK